MQSIFGMSFMYYSVFGTLVTVFVGIVASWWTKNRSGNSYSLRLLHPIVRKFIKTSESYASNDMLCKTAPQIRRKSTVYTIYDAEDIPKKLAATTTAKYTKKFNALVIQ